MEIGDSAGGDFHLEGNCTNFPQDIQPTDDDGTTLLDFWIEDLTADPIVMQVKVDDDLGSNQTVRVYYGKLAATTNRDGEATFPLFDDFDDDSINTDLWDTAGAPVESGGEIVGQISSKLTFGENYAIRGRARNPNGVVSSKYLLVWADAIAITNWIAYRTNLGKWIIEKYPPQVWTDTGVAADTDPHIFDIGKIGTTADFERDGNDDGTLTACPVINANKFVQFATDTYLDWVFVRKYNDPEPAFASAGAEQDAHVLGVRNPPMTGGMV